MDQTVSESGSQEQVNVHYWVRDHVGEWTNHHLRTVETVILERYAEALGGRVLEVGCGAGRLTGHLINLATEVHGIDISEPMIDHCRRTFPQGTFRVADLRDLRGYEDGYFDAVFASFNVIDLVSPEERGAALDSWRRVLAADGTLLMSSHNRGHIARVRSPAGQLLASFWSGKPRHIAGSIVRLPRWVRNHRRLRPFERREAECAVATDPATDYGILWSYISRDDQARQLAAHGFDLLECLAPDGMPVGPGEDAPNSSELHYIACVAQA
jgi:ubiquinone/menaquinone biosynthesis C-methylase UbiE